MKFGIFNFAPWHESVSQADVIYNVVEQATLADELGFSHYWLGEHHFTRHGIIGNTLTMASFLAARTDNIRLGTAVVVLPLHNPIRVAEEIGLVDVLSGGRVDVGLGSGYQRIEFDNLGVDMNESRARFAEGLDVLVAAWTKSPFTFEGNFQSWNAENNLEVSPRPVQKPHPPIYVAVTASPETIEFAAARGLRLLVGGPTDLMGIAPEVIDRWRKAMKSHGFDPSGMDIPCAKGIYVAATDEQAQADLDAIDVQWDLNIVAQIGSPMNAAGEVPPGYEHWKLRQADRVKKLNDRTAGTARLVGSPETVASRIEELQSAGLTAIFGQFGFPGMPYSKILDSVELFGKEVLPRFQSS